ncbi:uncharacterized protein LOC122060603 [Macadamia integrifolia]|uniref:uncharacterized protein LOC122060603 n=1 Tax=Macadamia integrifolia TaxID=60698 RepID=UPI001C528A88|nr:uncharacterized protein LOC122060603 [Macadamia integrifolia]
MVKASDFPSLLFNKLGYSGDLIHNDRVDKVLNLWLMWRQGSSRPSVVSLSDQQLSVTVDWLGCSVGLTFVHANFFKVNRRELWTDLGLVINPNTPWLVKGDFNATLLSNEKRGPGRFNASSAVEFQAMVDTCALVQAPSQGKKFTWTNNRRRGNVVAVLDRSFCNGNWLEVFRNINQIVLQRTASDHTPVLVVSDAIPKPGNIPFRFNNFWMENVNFEDIIREVWNKEVSGNPILVLSQKLKQVKIFIKSWARNNFPNVDEEVKKASKNLDLIQEEIEATGMIDDLFDREADAKTYLLKATQMQDSFWSQKAKQRWMKEGDRNSKFFHLSVQMRRLRNQIRTLKNINGEWISDQQRLSSYISEYYETFHSAA